MTSEALQQHVRSLIVALMAAAAAIPYFAVLGERTPTTVAPHGRT